MKVTIASMKVFNGDGELEFKQDVLGYSGQSYEFRRVRLPIFPNDGCDVESGESASNCQEECILCDSNPRTFAIRTPVSVQNTEIVMRTYRRPNPNT